MKAGCLLTARRKVANVFPAGTDKSQSVMTRQLSVRAFEGMFDPGVHFTIFIGYELIAGVTLLKAAEKLFAICTIFVAWGM